MGFWCREKGLEPSTLRRRILNPLPSTDSAIPAPEALHYLRNHSTHQLMAWTLDDFDYPLPQELIAQAPLACRTDSRLLQVSPNLPICISPTCLPFWRLATSPSSTTPGDPRPPVRHQGHRRPGRGDDRASPRPPRGPRPDPSRQQIAQARHPPAPRRRPRRGGARPRRRVLPPALSPGEDLSALLERHGRLPLPPYIERAAGDTDESRYQTVFARNPGLRSPRPPRPALRRSPARPPRRARVNSAYRHPSTWAPAPSSRCGC